MFAAEVRRLEAGNPNEAVRYAVSKLLRMFQRSGSFDYNPSPVAEPAAPTGEVLEKEEENDMDMEERRH